MVLNIGQQMNKKLEARSYVAAMCILRSKNQAISFDIYIFLMVHLICLGHTF